MAVVVVFGTSCARLRFRAVRRCGSSWKWRRSGMLDNDIRRAEPLKISQPTTCRGQKLDNFLNVFVHQIYTYNRAVRTPDPDNAVYVSNAIEDEKRPVVTADREPP